MGLVISFFCHLRRRSSFVAAFRTVCTMGESRGSKRPSTQSRDISPPPTRRKVEAPSTNNNKVADFFRPVSQKVPKQITWRYIENSCIVGKYAPQQEKNMPKKDGSRRRVAAFDFDHTLVATQSGNRFARDGNDWKWWSTTVPGKLKELNQQGYLIVVISNQKAVSLKKELKAGKSESKSLSTFKQKVTSVMRSLDIPLNIYAATEYDNYRKPRIGMWREMLEDHDLDEGDSLDLEGSVFVGDAAGRTGDHSCADRDMAANIGIPFQTPEEFFLDQPPELITRTFDPKAFVNQDTGADPQKPFSRLSDIELVICCGSPSAGKSTFYWKYLEPLGYERVNQDILKSRPKCLKVAREYLNSGKSVVVDNTNADPETRAHWVQLAKDTKVPIRCIYFSTPAEICKHNNAVRSANIETESMNPESRPLLPTIAFSDFAKRFREPTMSEGFQDITRIDFRFQGSAAAKKIWGQYWV